MIIADGPACPACSGQELHVVGRLPVVPTFAGHALEEPLSPGSLYRCGRCMLQFRFPRLSKAAFDALYRQGTDEIWQHAGDSRPDWVLAREWLRSRGSPRSVLDVGCFDGSFLDDPAFPTEGRFGIEVQPRAARLARSRGIRIVGTDFDDLRSLRATYDSVVAFDVIEHVHDPFDFLSRLAAVTKPGGQIVVGTGNSDSWSWRLMGSRYWYCAPAEHISFVNPRWCNWAASRAALSLEGISAFSHMPASRATKASEIIKNLIYRVSPAFFANLRRLGFGQLDLERNPSLAGHPPCWGSSVDHFLAYFAKPG